MKSSLLSNVLKWFRLTSCSHVIVKMSFFCHKRERAVAANHFFKFVMLFQNRGDIKFTNNMISPWLQACVFKVLLFDNINCSHPYFLYYLSLFQVSTWMDPFCQGYYVYFTILFAATHYIKQILVALGKS